MDVLNVSKNNADRESCSENGWKGYKYTQKRKTIINKGGRLNNIKQKQSDDKLRID